MQSMRGKMRTLVCVAVLVGGCLIVRGASNPVSGSTPQAQAASDQPVPATMTESQKKKAEVEQKRKKEIEADTAKLLELANELKVEMDKSSKDMLSLTVVRKADEIEKLARKVRQEMKSSMEN
jgi:hypothetical protein